MVARQIPIVCQEIPIAQETPKPIQSASNVNAFPPVLLLDVVKTIQIAKMVNTVQTRNLG